MSAQLKRAMALITRRSHQAIALALSEEASVWLCSHKARSRQVFLVSIDAGLAFTSSCRHVRCVQLGMSFRVTRARPFSHALSQKIPRRQDAGVIPKMRPTLHGTLMGIHCARTLEP